MRRWVLVASLAPMSACTLALPLSGLTGGGAGADASAEAASEASSETGGTGPFVIASGQDLPRDLAVSGGVVYWTTKSDAGTVASCPVTGCTGAPAVYASNLVLPAGIDVTSSTLFFGTFGGPPPDGSALDPGAGIFSCAASGCSMMPTSLDPAPGAIIGVTTDGQQVYWSDLGHGEVLSCAVGGCGGSPSVIASGIVSPWYGITTDASNVYFAGHGDGNVYVCPKSGCPGGTATKLATGLAGPYDLAVDSTTAYFTSYDPSNPNTPGAVLTCPLSGCGANPHVFASGQITPQGIAVDAKNVYWCDYASGASTIDWCPKSGCPASGPGILASGQAGAFLLTVDTGFVYWTNTDGGQIMRVAKP